MVLQDPAQLLRETLEGCDVDTDLDTIDRIGENLRVLQSEREQRILTEQRQLQQLSTQLLQQKEGISETETSQVRNDMKKRIKENQTVELGLNKSLKELTSSKQELSTGLSRLMDEFNALEKQIEDLDYDGDESDKDAVVYVCLRQRAI